MSRGVGPAFDRRARSSYLVDRDAIILPVVQLLLVHRPSVVLSGEREMGGKEGRADRWDRGLGDLGFSARARSYIIRIILIGIGIGIG